MAEEQDDKRFEVLCGVTLAVLAAILAVVDLGGGKYGGDELIAINEKASAYAWYSSKGVKETLVEGQRDTLKLLLESGALTPEVRPGIESQVSELDAAAQRYGREKKEILLGSAKVGQEGWSQEVDGELGKVTGANEWKELADGLGAAGDVFDRSTLFLQISLVLGAIGLVVQDHRLRWGFYAAMALLGGIGSIIGGMAYQAAWAVV